MVNEWEAEPNEVDFVDDATGYKCAMRRNTGGAWCGYVNVPFWHPWHGKDYSDRIHGAEIADDTTVDEVGIIAAFCAAGGPKDSVSIDLLVPCHGGLTYAGVPWWNRAAADEWWFGFDCSHSGDYAPKLQLHDRGGVYRNLEYVKAACRKAAGAIAKSEGR